jgi:hypothetical protein
LSIIESDTEDENIKMSENELTFDEVLKKSFHIYQSRFVDFFFLFMLIGLVDGVIDTVLKASGLVDPTTSLAGIIILFIVYWIFSTIANGIAVKYSNELLIKQEAGLRESLDFTLSKTFSLLGAGIASIFLIIIGFVLLIIPGIIFIIMFSLMVPVIIIEGSSAIDSMRRSRRLVSNRWRRTFAVIIIVVILQAILSWTANTISSPLGNFSWIISTTATAFIQPVLPIASVILYYSMRIKEQSSEKETAKKPTFFCPNCGQPVFSEDAFCRGCGRRTHNLVEKEGT